MALGIIGRKLGMTQIFDREGNRIPVTAVEAGPCTVVRTKTPQKDGYSALQLGFQSVKMERLNRPDAGQFKKRDLDGKRILREFRCEESEVSERQVGDEITTEIFNQGESVDVTGTSKGKGFTGVMKRHNFRGAKATHGTHEYFRHAGSIGCCFPQHTIKGMRMPGQMGNCKVTTRNLKVLEVESERNLILLRGSVPGATGGLVILKKR